MLQQGGCPTAHASTNPRFVDPATTVNKDLGPPVLVHHPRPTIQRHTAADGNPKTRALPCVTPQDQTLPFSSLVHFAFFAETLLLSSAVHKTKSLSPPQIPMPRRNRVDDLDFEIHVDPSCLSDTMEENPKDAKVDIEKDKIEEHKTEAKVDPVADVEVLEKHKDDDLYASESESDREVSELNLENANHELHNASDVDHQEVEHDLPKTTQAESSWEDVEDDDEDHHDLVDRSINEDSYIEDETRVTEDLEHEDIEGHDDSLLHDEEGDDLHHDQSYSEGTDSRRESAMTSSSYESPRRHSQRTEALIHQAAQDIVAKIGHPNPRDSLQSVTDQDDDSYLSHSQPASNRQSDAHMSVGGDSHYSHEEEERRSVDNGSSHHDNDNDDDVFSDRSLRSSMGSVSESDHRKPEESKSRSFASHRVSGVSGISGISEYEREEEFVPTIRGTPRPAFRSPSSVKALQMSSPPASALGSPRSSRRFPTVSRLGSPSVSAQYSPKKTPPRFKRNTPPLVLLHVTLLPLRWGWGDVLDHAENEDLSTDCKNLREAWRQLQDRMGDTTVERGILLPHPQNDYEVLEERLLEALELPMRRRARILECGHYLGPSNEMNFDGSDSDEDDYDEEERRSSRLSMLQKTHWCKTCRSEIRYESLGPGKIFRVKVYASNGLMKAGAWEACWKEMERVDVELEPVVDVAVEEELGHLEVKQLKELEDQERALEEQERLIEEKERALEEQERLLEERERERERQWAEEEARRLAEEEERREAEEQKRIVEEEKRLAEEEARLIAEAKRVAEEEARQIAEAEERRIAEERRVAAEEEEKRVAEERRVAKEEEQKLLAAEEEKKHLAEEAEERRLANLAEEERIAEEERLLDEEERLLAEEEERLARRESEELDDIAHTEQANRSLGEESHLENVQPENIPVEDGPTDKPRDSLSADTPLETQARSVEEEPKVEDLSIVEEHAEDLPETSRELPTDLVEDDAQELHNEAPKEAHDMSSTLDDHNEEPEPSFVDRSIVEPTPEPESQSATLAPSPEIHVGSPPAYEERHQQEEQRMRDMYGATPGESSTARDIFEPQGRTEYEKQRAQSEEELHKPATSPRASDYMQQEKSQSPATETYTPRDVLQQDIKNASLPDLLLQSARVLMQDKKNIIIVLLSVLILMVALRGNPPERDPMTFQTVINHEVPTVTVTQGALVETVESLQTFSTTTESYSEPTQEYFAPLDRQISTPDMENEIEKVESDIAPLEVEENQTASIESFSEPTQEVFSETVSPARFEIEPPPASKARNQYSPESMASPSSESHTPTSASQTTESVDPCASCSLSARDSCSSRLRAQAAASQAPEVAALEAPPREPETVISERIVRIVETVTQVETATVKVTATETQIVHSVATEQASVVEEKVAESQAPAEEQVSESSLEVLGGKGKQEL